MSNKGKKNIYACKNNHMMVTVDRDAGTTPFMTMCPECGERAQSSFYRVNQDLEPTHEWYKAEIKSGMDEWTKHHISLGGLLLREIEAATNE